jgi:hypothetical protein
MHTYAPARETEFRPNELFDAMVMESMVTSKVSTETDNLAAEDGAEHASVIQIGGIHVGIQQS